jgi:hypothetical protein
VEGGHELLGIDDMVLDHIREVLGLVEDVGQVELGGHLQGLLAVDIEVVLADTRADDPPKP